jgi:hypothetical protein
MDNFELISRIKHEAGSKILGLSSALNNINTVIKKNSLCNELINEKFNITVSDSINTAMQSINELHLILKKYEDLTT